MEKETTVIPRRQHFGRWKVEEVVVTGMADTGPGNLGAQRRTCLHPAED